ncbi:MAG: histidine kinase [Flavobacteriaceae bacterium]
MSEQARKTEEEKSKKQRAQFLFYGLAFAFLTFIIVGYIYYRNYRLKQMTKLEQLENEAQTRIINATIDAKEMERKSIAQTLHDSVSALLSSANLHLQATKAQLKKDAPQEISKAQTIVNEASVKIRDLSHELISSVLLKFGLAFAVHDMCQKYSNSEISLHSDDDGIKRYDQDFEIKVYNIIEELVNNILKHSKATNATIMLSHRENDMLSIRISDDGVGFDIKKAKNKDGLGLSHINARIKVMKGVFNIVSSKGNGTSIFMLIPIKYKG